MLEFFCHQPVTQNVSNTAIDLTSLLWFNKVVIDGSGEYNIQKVRGKKNLISQLTAFSPGCGASFILAVIFSHQQQ